MTLDSIRLSRGAPARHPLKLVLSAVIAVAAATTCAAASVKEGISLSKAVEYADLDLSQPAHAAKLYARLQNAAQAVCGEEDLRLLNRWHLQRRCYQQALNEAVARVDHAAITALHASGARQRLALRGHSLRMRDGSGLPSRASRSVM